MGPILKLIYSPVGSLWPGNVLRFPGRYPYEDLVDFMVFDIPASERAYGLIVTSGYKAGSVVVHFPKESFSEQGGINKEWVVVNWGGWVYGECDVSEVYLIERYEAVPVQVENRGILS